METVNVVMEIITLQLKFVILVMLVANHAHLLVAVPLVMITLIKIITMMEVVPVSNLIISSILKITSVNNVDRDVLLVPALVLVLHAIQVQVIITMELAPVLDQINILIAL